MAAGPSCGWVSLVVGEGGWGQISVDRPPCFGTTPDSSAGLLRYTAHHQQLEGYYASVVKALPPGECELLYGRAGYLYSLLWAEAQLGAGAVDGAVVREVVSHLLSQGVAGARATDPSFGLMYQWHGKSYLGAAHGLCGVVHCLLHCFAAVQEVDPSGAAAAAVRKACDALAAEVLPSGNLPSSLGHREDRWAVASVFLEVQRLAGDGFLAGQWTGDQQLGCPVHTHGNHSSLDKTTTHTHGQVGPVVPRRSRSDPHPAESRGGAGRGRALPGSGAQGSKSGVAQGSAEQGGLHTPAGLRGLRGTRAVFEFFRIASSQNQRLICLDRQSRVKGVGLCHGIRCVTICDG
jgi:hypothetical protein